MINSFKIIIFFLCYVGLQPAIAQKQDAVTNQKKKSSSLVVGLGGSYANLLDQGISPLFYEGLGGAVAIGLIEQTKNLSYQSLVRFDFNNLYSEVSGANIYSFRTEGLIDVFIKKWSMVKNSLEFTPGLSLQYKWLLKSHTSFTNNSQNLQNSIKFSPSLNTSFPFKLFNRAFTFGNIIRLPIINYTVRPIYASSKFPATYQEDDIGWIDYLKSGTFYGWGNYFGLDAQTYMVFHFNESKNALKLDYFWSYDKLNSENAVQEGQHSLMISLMVRL